MGAKDQPVLLSTAYFGPIQYYSKIISHPKIYIDQFENFTKQTYRNRCEILGANGIIALIVPIIKGKGAKTLIKDIRISYDTDWQRNHWRTIFSAYNSSPFFEFYKDALKPFFETRWKYLLDLNMNIHQEICELLQIKNVAVLTKNFEDVPENCLNLREKISPKKHKTNHDKHFQPQEYRQVFFERFKFITNLSIMDLLFNQGPNSYLILNSSTA